MSELRVLLVDDHEVVRAGIKALLDAQDDIVVVGEAGTATGLVLHQGGRDMAAKRLAAEAPPAKERKEIALDGTVLDRYVGRYQLAPGFFVAITREGGQLFLQATGQGKAPMFAESETEFFLKVVDAQVTFVREGEGPASKLILHQNGMDLPAPRTE